MRAKKTNLEQNGTYERIYGTSGAFVWCVGSLIAYQCLDFIRHMKQYGDGGLHSYLISVWSYMELMALQPCLGGPYHFSYTYIGEFVGFMTGWYTVLSFGLASQLKEAGDIIDEAFFSGSMKRTIETYVELGPSQYFDEHLDLWTFMIGLTISGVVSSNRKEMKMLNTILFFMSQTCLFGLAVLFMGFINLDNWIYFKLEHLRVLSHSFIPSSAVYSPIFALTFLGEEAINPSESLPKAQFLSYFYALVLYGGFSVLTCLAWSYEDIGDGNPIGSILILLKVNGLLYIQALNVPCFIFSSLFLQMMSFTRILCAMSRDGLIFQIFSKVQNVTTTFLCGIMAGIIAVCVNPGVVNMTKATSFLLVAAIGPICVLKLRYSRDTRWITQGSSRPNIYSEHIVSVLVISAIGASITLSNILLINRENLALKFIFLIVFGIICTASFTFLCAQPQIKIETVYKVRLVPLLPTLNIFCLSFTLVYLTMSQIIILIVWFLIGFVLYASYSVWHSKEIQNKKPEENDKTENENQ